MSDGIEVIFCNFLEPSDVAVVGVNGLFGERMAGNIRGVAPRLQR
jgi:aspartate aminotransferase-like enzyme